MKTTVKDLKELINDLDDNTPIYYLYDGSLVPLNDEYDSDENGVYAIDETSDKIAYDIDEEETAKSFVILGLEKDGNLYDAKNFGLARLK